MCVVAEPNPVGPSHPRGVLVTPRWFVRASENVAVFR